MKRYSIFVFFIIAGTLFSLVYLLFPERKESQSQDVVESNSFRRKYNIPVIESDWIREDLGQSREKWHDGVRGIGASYPIHLYKEIAYKDGVIDEEKDAFHFEFSDSLQYRLIVYNEYLQDSAAGKRTKNELIFYHPDKFPPSHSEFLSNEEADSVLRAWKIGF